MVRCQSRSFDKLRQKTAGRQGVTAVVLSLLGSSADVHAEHWLQWCASWLCEMAMLLYALPSKCTIAVGPGVPSCSHEQGSVLTFRCFACLFPHVQEHGLRQITVKTYVWYDTPHQRWLLRTAVTANTRDEKITFPGLTTYPGVPIWRITPWAYISLLLWSSRVFFKHRRKSYTQKKKSRADILMLLLLIVLIDVFCWCKIVCLYSYHQMGI